MFHTDWGDFGFNSNPAAQYLSFSLDKSDVSTLHLASVPTQFIQS